jgi:hypothetical protein
VDFIAVGGEHWFAFLEAGLFMRQKAERTSLCFL